MSTFAFIKRIFGGDEIAPEEQKALFEELLFLTLARASRSDLDISSVEISQIQSILKEEADLEKDEQEIRTAGMSELYEEAPLDRYVAKVAGQLTVAHRQTIVRSLYAVIGADGRFTRSEANFFNNIAEALELEPVELLGAQVDD